MIYIMVTIHPDVFYDGGHPSYNTRNFQREMDETKILSGEEVTTIFIEARVGTLDRKCWLGKTSNFSRHNNTIHFDVKIDQEIDCPDKYIGYSAGWYCEEKESVPEPEEPNEIFAPPFFSILQETTDYRKFEELTHKLLKIIGIDDIFPFPADRQRGTADGFFRLNNLVVIYDSTLENNWETAKETQIQNYCNQLRGGPLEYNNNRIDIQNCHKQVWIVTRGTTRSIRTINGIEVKEISIGRLIQIYHERLVNNWTEGHLEDKLKNI